MNEQWLRIFFYLLGAFVAGLVMWNFATLQKLAVEDERLGTNQQWIKDELMTIEKSLDRIGEKPR